MVSNVGCEQLRPFGQAASLLSNISNVLGVINWMQARDTLWEVLPFSFVVDWFINFNNVWRIPAEQRLQAIDVKNLGYSTKKTYVFEPELQLIQFGWPYDQWPPSEYVGQNMSNLITNIKPPSYKSGFGKTTTYQRSVGLPPTTENVFTSQGLSVLHGADALSLVSQRVREVTKTIYQRK